MRKLPVLLITAFVMPAVSTMEFNGGGNSFYDPGAYIRTFTFIPDIPDVPGFNSGSTLFPSSSLSSSSSSISSPEEDYFYCERYGPFSLENPTDVTASFTYGLYSISSQNIIERMRIFRGSNVAASSSKSIFYYEKGARKTVSFTIPIRDYYTADGLTLKIEILDSNYSVLKAFSASFNPPANSVIHSTVLKTSVYHSKSLGFYGDGSEMKEFVETFDFTTFGDYLDIDYYYRLDINRNKFSYPNSDIELSYKSINLLFNDSDYLFPSMTHDSYGDIYIPLTLQRVGNTVNFKYKNSFYVNKRSLDISDTYKQGYVATRDFYLPINKRKSFNGKNLYIEIKQLGLDKISTTLALRYQIDRAIVGLSTDGESYVVGGNRR